MVREMTMKVTAVLLKPMASITKPDIVGPRKLPRWKDASHRARKGDVALWHNFRHVYSVQNTSNLFASKNQMFATPSPLYRDESFSRKLSNESPVSKWSQ